MYFDSSYNQTVSFEPVKPSNEPYVANYKAKSEKNEAIDFLSAVGAKSNKAKKISPLTKDSAYLLTDKSK